VEAARAWSVPRSEFLGWDDDDRGYALALLALESETCTGCGHPVAESMDVANQYAYRAELLRCHACAAADSATDVDGINHAGLRVRVMRR
jgi:hypothetical protein